MRASELLQRFSEGQRAFIGADLSGADLNGAHLSGADLSAANLRGANLRGGTLIGSNLTGATLSSAVLARASLSKARLAGAKLSEVDLSQATLHGADLTRAGLVGARLIDADLRGANLNHADLRGADLTRANLVGANLRKARLASAQVNEADLSGSDLSGADLSEANLGKANLSEADLRGANVIDVDLGEARLVGASFGSTVFSDLDLSSIVRDLMAVRHRAPSSIDTKTLTRSRGRVPPAFLRGCGLSDWEIEQAKLYDPALSSQEVADILYRVHEIRAGSPIQYYSVFISHSHADKAIAERLYEALQEQGIRCWLDTKQLLPGDDIHDGIEHGIRLWDKVILCASRHSLMSWWVDVEIEKAFAKEQTLMRERGERVLVLIPLVLDEYLFEGWKSGKASEVKRRMAGDFRAHADVTFNFRAAVEPLIRALRADGRGRESPPTPRL